MISMLSLQKVLLIEDDRSIAGALAHALKSSYEIDVATTGEVALQKITADHFSIIVLDLSLPDISGIIVCQQIRNRDVKVPILILSADNNVLTKIKLLDAGANDYLSKPFSLGELKARLRALSRNSPDLQIKTPQLSIGDIQLNRQTFEVLRGGVTVKLRRKEFALLECLMEHAGSVVTRNALTRYAWQGVDNLWTNAVDVHIKYLRDKIDRPFGQSIIQTVHGLGYKIDVVQPTVILAEK